MSEEISRPETSTEIELAPPRLHGLRSLAERWAQTVGFDSTAISEILAGFDEALANIHLHSYSARPGTVRIDVETTPQELIFRISDHGKAFIPEHAPRRQPGEIGQGGWHAPDAKGVRQDRAQTRRRKKYTASRTSPSRPKRRVMKLHFWGTRGSIPTPSTSSIPTQEFGGDTTCLSLDWGKENLLIFDAGSGLRQAGLEWAAQGRRSFTFLFTHSHWDHLQGFPFFTPAFQPGTEITIYSPRLPGAHAGNLIERSLHAQQSEPFFPAGFPMLRAKIIFHEIQPGHPLQLSHGSNSLEIHAAAVSHPGGCLAYRVQGSPGGKNCSFVFASDHEPTPSAPSPIRELAHETDLLICDGQYTPAEHAQRIGWGHGTPELCLQEAIAAGARRLLITHFDPTHSDATLAQLEKGFQKTAHSSGIPVAFARQGQTVAL